MRLRSAGFALISCRAISTFIGKTRTKNVGFYAKIDVIKQLL